MMTTNTLGLKHIVFDEKRTSPDRYSSCDFNDYIVDNYPDVCKRPRRIRPRHIVRHRKNTTPGHATTLRKYRGNGFTRGLAAIICGRRVRF